MNKILFSIYTERGGHQVLAFPHFSERDGKSAFVQVVEYAREVYNDPNDVPVIYSLCKVDCDLTPAAVHDDNYNDDMDGDHESALASAGFGTDEDYEHDTPMGDDYGGE